MAHHSHIQNEKYRQWVKAGLGLGYLKEGLAPFCDDVAKQQHKDILDYIKQTKNVPSVLCGTCTLKTLQPDHVKLGNKQCPLGHANCNCCYTAGKNPCPSNVCGAIYDSIITYHASTPPAPYWKNTQTQQWIADPWSIAKCFINAPGYEQKTSTADTDCTGLLHVIINNKYFHNHVSCNMTLPNCFSKVRQYRNEIFHSSTQELDNQKTNNYIDDMIAVLQDGKELIHRQDAQEAVKKLQDLKEEAFIITVEDVEKVLGDIKEDLSLIKGTTEGLEKDNEDQKRKFANLESNISELEEVRQYRNEIFHSSTMELDKQKTNKYIDDMIAVLQDDKELIHRQDAQEAVKKLQDLKEEAFIITVEDVEKVLGDITDALSLIKGTVEGLEKDNEDQKRKFANLESNTSELEEKIKYLMDVSAKKNMDYDSPKAEKRNVNVPDGFENDPYYLKLYIHAISYGVERDSTIRVNVVGNFGQGKTTLINRLLQEPIAGIESTNSVDIKHCKYTQGNFMLSPTEQFENNDNSLERLASIVQSDRTKECQDKIINSHENSETDSPPNSFDSEKETDFTEDSNIEENNIKQQFETKSDQNYEEIKIGEQSLESMKQKREHKLTVSKHDQERFKKLVNNSQKNEVPMKNLEIWDFGGQFLFYATHNLFHSRRAVYILVFDLSKQLNSIVNDSECPDADKGKTMEEYAKFWINSIHAYVGSENGTEPPVILVGTHKDKLAGDEHAKQGLSEDYFDQIRTLFESTNMLGHIQPADFAVDNTNPNDNDIVKLREELIQQGEKLTEISIPAKWIPLERAVRRHRHEKIISFEMLMQLDSENEISLKDEEQVKLFLRYHHTKGTLLYFDEEPISSYVVLDTKYLIDAFKCIITSKQFCKKKDPSSRKLWKRLNTEARLENELIETLWDMKTKHSFWKHKKELLMFLEKHLIISEASEYCEESQTSHGLGWYIVPSFLPTNTSEVIMNTFITGRQQTSVRFVMSFYKSPLVQVLYYRLLSALIGRWSIIQISSPQEKALIYKNLGVFRLDINHAGIVEYKYNDIELRVLSLISSLNVDRKCTDEFRRFSESIVENEFKKFRPSKAQQEKPYDICFRCNNESHGPSGGTKNLSLDHIRGQIKEPCPDTLSHVIDPRQILSEWFLQDKIKVLFPEHQFNEKELSSIALAIGKNWELLGLKLGLDSSQIQRIEMDQATSEMKNYNMLLQWKNGEGDEATVNSLIRAMETLDCDCVNWDKIRNIVDKINSEGHKN